MKICNFWLKIKKEIVQTLKIPVNVIVIFFSVFSHNFKLEIKRGKQIMLQWLIQ